jgi:hypothetical protein
MRYVKVKHLNALSSTELQAILNIHTILLMMHITAKLWTPPCFHWGSQNNKLEICVAVTQNVYRDSAGVVGVSVDR